jgi:hypothetical protein
MDTENAGDLGGIPAVVQHTDDVSALIGRQFRPATAYSPALASGPQTGFGLPRASRKFFEKFGNQHCDLQTLAGCRVAGMPLFPKS